VRARTSSTSGSHLSMVTERTCETCTPMFLCTPAHLMQINIPRLIDAQIGSGV
jgi:hypothetical protein